MKPFSVFGLSILLLTAMCVVLTACGGGDDDSIGGGASDDSGVIGQKVTPATAKAVDLGIVVNGKNVKWANMNVGATSESDYGLYFAWGETVGYSLEDSHKFSMENYKWYDNSNQILTKYCINRKYGINDRSYGTLDKVDNKTMLDREDDAAAVNFGGSWRMPTKEEWEALVATYNNTKDYTWKRELVEDVHHWGYRITQKSTGNSIFLPQGGSHSGKNQYSNGLYWSSTLDMSDYYSNKYAPVFRMYVSYGVSISSDNRNNGLSVRAVWVE